MKNLNIVICLLFITVCFNQFSIGQSGAWYDGLDLNPQTEAGIEFLNGKIVHAYAPIIVQIESSDDELDDSNNTDDDGLSDRPVAVDFDNDWDPANNWVNLGLYSSHFATPEAYYHVIWTEEYWVIVYSLYYARDWAIIFDCLGTDRHEGDMPKITVVVTRPTVDYPIPVISGFVTPNHGSNDVVDCVYSSCEGMMSGNQSPFYTLGEHVEVFVATGTHAIYSSYSSAQLDGGNPCNPNPSNPKTYLPVHSPAGASSIDPPPYIDESMCNLSFTNTLGAYELIDVYTTLWQKRDDPLVFSGTSYLEQQFHCSVGVCEKAPAPPWTGKPSNNFLGPNPLGWMEDVIGEFECDCNSSPCIAGEISDDTYVYNPFLCHLYDIEMPPTFDCDGIQVPNPYQFGDDVMAVFSFGFQGYVGSPTSITWYWDSNGYTIEHSGQGTSRLVLTVKNALVEDLINVADEFSVSVVANYIECGQLEGLISIDDQVNIFIDTTSNCQEMVLEVNEDFHLNGNVYTWDFFSYDALATVSNNGKKVEFNTEDVDGQIPSGTTDPKLDYTLNITNSGAVVNFNINGSIDIPACDFGGTLGLMIYPNPGTSSVTLDFQKVYDEQLDIHILDFQLNRVKTVKFTQGQTLDISYLENGLYYLYTVTEDGKAISEKFCVGGH